ncbi:uncharacterized protein LOC135683534 [Rhopilema esculentum]|uniref:uncharacterized protein LOC135683534 n=1 Tax=Rhopilema esculentum TaxID=499914 RepID=UPI0031DA68D4
MYLQQNKLFQSKMGVLELNGVDSKKVLATLDEPCSGVPRKRRRLDDLTAEERVLRRKLKNRVAAQTARDRKKARMSELECIVTQIERENHLLKTSNEELRARLQMVSEENIKLKDRFGLSPHSTSSDHEYAAPCPLPQSAKSSSKERIDVTDIISDTDQIVIKTEEGLPEYASFRNVSLQQKFQILLLSLIWLHSLSLKTSTSLDKPAKKLRWMRSLVQFLSKLKNVTAILRMLCHLSLGAPQAPQTRVLMGTPLKTSASLEMFQAWWATRPLMKFS